MADFWGVAAYSNPAGCSNKLTNLIRFADRVRRQGLNLMLVEQVLDDAIPVVPSICADRMIVVRGGDVLWQKERLLNIGINALPAECSKVAWLDADILFENPEWVECTDAILDHVIIVQPWQHAYWLTRDGAIAHALRGVAFTMARRRVISQVEGHPGFAWAARRELFDDNALYDRAVIGGATAIIANSLYGEAALGPEFLSDFGSAHARDVLDWAAKFHARVRGSVGYTIGAITHLWHGEMADRRYRARLQILRDEQFHPGRDIVAGAGEAWRWNTDKHDLHRRVRDYFFSRREDGAFHETEN